MGIVKTWTLLSSACYWAWFDSAIFRPTLFLPFDGALSLFTLYFIVVMLSSALSLLMGSLINKRITPIITLKPYGVMSVGAAFFSSLVTMAGAYLQSTVIVVAGAIVTGSCCAFFLLEWARMYSQQGARSAGILISAAIALGVLIDLLPIVLAPIIAAFFTATLPIIVVGFLLSAYSLINTPENWDSVSELRSDSAEDSSETANNDVGISSQGTLGKKRFAMLSDSLVVALCVFGFAFGFMQFNVVFSVVESYSFHSDILLVSQGVTALLIFVAIRFLPRRILFVFRIGIVIGIIGFIAISSVNAYFENRLIAGILVETGYTTFAIVSWTILAEIAFTTRSSTVLVYGFGRFVLHASIVLGSVAALTLSVIPLLSIHQGAFTSTLACLLVFAGMLLLSDKSGLTLLTRVRSTPLRNALPSPLSQTYPKQEADFTESFSRVVKEYGLTQREADVLRLLLTGRSTLRVAQILCISENTVASHIQHIYSKLSVHNRQDLLDRFS